MFTKDTLPRYPSEAERREIRASLEAAPRISKQQIIEALDANLGTPFWIVAGELGVEEVRVRLTARERHYDALKRP